MGQDNIKVTLEYPGEETRVFFASAVTLIATDSTKTNGGMFVNDASNLLLAIHFAGLLQIKEEFEKEHLDISKYGEVLHAIEQSGSKSESEQ